MLLDKAFNSLRNFRGFARKEEPFTQKKHRFHRMFFLWKRVAFVFFLPYNIETKYSLY